MRLYRPPVIGPRAAGISLVLIGITVFVLLGLFSSDPAAAQGTTNTSSPGFERVRCHEFNSQLAAQSYLDTVGQELSNVLDTDRDGISCEPAVGSERSEAAAMVVQHTAEGSQGRVFLTLATVTLGAAIFLEGRLTPRRQGAHRDQRGSQDAGNGKHTHAVVARCVERRSGNVARDVDATFLRVE